MSTAQPLIFNPLDPGFRVDPYPIYRRLLEEQPVHLTPFGVPAFARYDDCFAILRDHKRFSSDETKSPDYVLQHQAIEAQAESLGADFNEGDRPFLFLDPPDHSRLRRLVNQAFTPRAVEGLRPRIQQIVDALLDKAASTDSMDVVAELAYPLPVIVICEMLGVPAEDQATFRVWSSELARSLDPEITQPPDVLERRVRAISESREYFRGLVAEHRAAPRPDILSALIAAEEEGDKLGEGELLSTCTLLLIAGHETTVNLIANGLLQLLRHPQELARFTSEPGLAPSVVEEVLRFDPPVQFDGRIALEEMEFGGLKLTRGQFVMLLLGAANRDSSHFADPNRFDITRNDDRHLAFGYGIHFCLGAPLARLEGQIALRTLVERFRALELATDPPPYKESITLRGPSALPISFRAA